MAEVVGVVAGGVSIVQIAGQVASSVVKIKIFWDRVKGAPDEINHLLREVESFSLILQHIQNDLVRNPLPELIFNNDGMIQSLELCKTGAAELEELVSDLTAKLEGKSGLRMKMSAARIVLKKEDIQSAKRKMKSAIRLLSLAYQCHTSAMIRLQPEIILARLSASMAASAGQRVVDLDFQPASTENQVVRTTNSDSTDLVTQCYTTWTRSPSWLRFLFGSVKYSRRNFQRRGQQRDIHEARYKLPELISSKSWDFTYYTSLSDWSVNIRTYRTITRDEPVLDAIRKGDILLIQSLLSSRKAFITDRDLSGKTLLHFAAFYGRLDICKLLVTQGADVCISNAAQQTPLEWLPYVESYRNYDRWAQNKYEIARLLVEAGAFNGVANEVNVFKNFEDGINTFQYLQQQMCCSYYDLPLSERIKIALSLDYAYTTEADLIRLAITPSQIDEEMATFVDVEGKTLLSKATTWFTFHWFTFGSGYRWGFKGKWDDEWHTLIKELLSANACPHAINLNRRSILGGIISKGLGFVNGRTPSEKFRLISEVIHFWLVDLKEAGTDVMQYGAEEHAMHGSGDVDNFYTYCFEPFKSCEISLINFSYGPHPEDWTFCFSEPTDSFAGEFWKLIEQVKIDEMDLPMPGAWIDTS